MIQEYMTRFYTNYLPKSKKCPSGEQIRTQAWLARRLVTCFSKAAVEADPMPVMAAPENLHVAEAAQQDLADLYAEGLQLEEILQYERQQLQEMELQAEIDEMERLMALERHQLYEATINSLEDANLAKDTALAKRKHKQLIIAHPPQERKTKEPRFAHAAEETRATESRIAHAAKETRAMEPRIAHSAEETRAMEPRIAHSAEETGAMEPRVAHSAEETGAMEPRVAHSAEETRVMEPRVAHSAEETKVMEPRVAHSAAVMESLEQPSIALGTEQERVTKKPRVSEAEAKGASRGVVDAEKIATASLCIPSQCAPGRLATS
ncbi:unnamed protein product [Symbiodinium microadriaticum]|nr:unnamed protein product [Symbiodinium microadriaticum]CAE7296711.1 unnamed protein product [Symbiodinium sp. KB8]